MKRRSNQPGHRVQQVLLSFGDARRLRHAGSHGDADQSVPGPRSWSVLPGTERGDTPPQVTAPGLEDHFQLVTARRGGHVYVTVVGALDVSSSTSFLDAVETLVHAGVHSIVVDLGRAAVVEGPGLSAIERARSLLDGRGGELVIKSPHADTLALLDHAGLSDTFVVI